MGQIEHRLANLGIVLPKPALPLANYVPYTRAGNLLVISGQICLGADGKLSEAHIGKLGGAVSLDAGREAARLCAINLLAQAQAALGNLDLIRKCLRLGGFIAAVPEFTTLPQVMNGASDLMVDVLGDAGKHARYAVGVPVLPLDAAVEVEAMFEVA